MLLGDGTAALMPEREVEVVLNDFVEACRARLGVQLVRGPPPVEELAAPNQSTATGSLMSSIEMRVEERFAQALSPGDRQPLEARMLEALAHFTTADLTSRRSMLSMSWDAALTHPTQAQLWASVLGAPRRRRIATVLIGVVRRGCLGDDTRRIARFVGGVVSAEYLTFGVRVPVNRCVWMRVGELQPQGGVGGSWA